MIWGVILVGAVILVLLQLFVPERAMDALEADRHSESLLCEPDEAFFLQIHVENRSRRLFPFVSVTQKISFLGGKIIEDSFWLGPRQKRIRQYPLTIHRRGRYVLDDMKLSSGDYMGLREYSRTCGSYREIVVPPKALSTARFDVLMGGFLGDVSINRFILEDPVLTLGYREYTGTDPMKRISWVQSARHNQLMVKKNDFTVEPSVSVLLNVQTNLEDAEQTQEACYSLARTVCQLLERKGVRYSFSSNAQLLGYKHSGTGTAGFGQRHFHAILETLGRSIGESAVPLSVFLEKELQRPERCGRILITPGGSETDTKMLMRLREHGPLLVLKGTEVAQWE